PSAVTENSSAPNMLFVSLSATAGMPALAVSATSCFSGTAPSSSECWEWVRRWMNRGESLIRAKIGPDGAEGNASWPFRDRGQRHQHGIGVVPRLQPEFRAPVIDQIIFGIEPAMDQLGRAV